MLVTVASFKGGVGKSTTAVHLAAYLAGRGTTCLVDGDRNRSVSKWARRGSLPFRVADERQAARVAREYEHLVFDTPARPDRDELESLAGGCDLLVLPSTPEAMALDALMDTVDVLRELGAERFRILLTMAPPRPSRDADEARATLVAAGLPVFAGQVRRLVAFTKASLAGVVVRDVKDARAAEAWADYQAVGAEVMP
jgi:chromosome partitioning protein